jgi:hypothetical protein
MIKIALIVSAIVLIPVIAQADLYTWEDESGSVFFADDISKVPPKYSTRVKKSGLSDQSNSISTGGDRIAGSRAEEPVAESKSRPNHATPGDPNQSRQGNVDYNGKSEAQWRTEANNLRSEIQDEETGMKLTIEQERECEESQRYVSACRRVNCPTRYEGNKQRIEQHIKTLKRKLDVVLPEEARKAGANPGWLRE